MEKNTDRTPSIIRVRKSIPGVGDPNAKYIACDDKGNPIRGFKKLSEVRKHWLKEIVWRKVILVRELDKTPDYTTINETSRLLLWSATRKG